MTDAPVRVLRREAIIDAACQVMAEQGLATTRVADVAARAGISAGHVLYYFESKADLFLQSLRAVEDRLRDEALARCEPLTTAAERWDAMLDTMAPGGQGDFKLLLWLEAWELAPRDAHVARFIADLDARWQALLLDVLHFGQQTGEIAADADVEDFVERFSAFFDGLTIQVVIGVRSIDRERMLAICRSYAASELDWDALRA